MEKAKNPSIIPMECPDEILRHGAGIYQPLSDAERQELSHLEERNMHWHGRYTILNRRRLAEMGEPYVAMSDQPYTMQGIFQKVISHEVLADFLIRPNWTNFIHRESVSFPLQKAVIRNVVKKLHRLLPNPKQQVERFKDAAFQLGTWLPHFRLGKEKPQHEVFSYLLKILLNESEHWQASFDRETLARKQLLHGYAYSIAAPPTLPEREEKAIRRTKQAKWIKGHFLWHLNNVNISRVSEEDYKVLVPCWGEAFGSERELKSNLNKMLRKSGLWRQRRFPRNGSRFWERAVPL